VVNGCFVAAAARPATLLLDGDRIEVVAPMQEADRRSMANLSRDCFKSGAIRPPSSNAP
jgi:hypothetical protein